MTSGSTAVGVPITLAFSADQNDADLQAAFARYQAIIFTHPASSRAKRCEKEEGGGGGGRGGGGGEREREGGRERKNGREGDGGNLERSHELPLFLSTSRSVMQYAYKEERESKRVRDKERKRI